MTQTRHQQVQFLAAYIGDSRLLPSDFEEVAIAEHYSAAKQLVLCLFFLFSCKSCFIHCIRFHVKPHKHTAPRRGANTVMSVMAPEICVGLVQERRRESGWLAGWMVSELEVRCEGG